ncbi:hypothetical protein [Sphingomonas sp. Ant20]|nr:hypothetical protein [Sphingomonas sp. Ant20]
MADGGVFRHKVADRVLKDGLVVVEIEWHFCSPAEAGAQEPRAQRS